MQSLKSVTNDSLLVLWDLRLNGPSLSRSLSRSRSLSLSLSRSLSLSLLLSLLLSRSRSLSRPRSRSLSLSLSRSRSLSRSLSRSRSKSRFDAPPPSSSSRERSAGLTKLQQEVKINFILVSQSVQITSTQSVIYAYLSYRAFLWVLLADCKRKKVD